MVPIIFLVLVFYFLLLRPQVQEEKKRKSLIDNLKKGDKVITSGGLWGEIDTVEPHKVRLKLNDKMKIVVSRAAIRGFQPDTPNEENNS